MPADPPDDPFMPRLSAAGTASPRSMGGPDARPAAPATKPYVAPYGRTAPQAPKQDPLDAAYARWRSSKDGDLNEVVTAAAPILDRAATSYAGGSSPLVRSRARIMAAKAIETYKPEGGAALKSWLMSNLQGLTRYKLQLTPFKAPEQIKYDMARVSRVRAEFTDEHGRPPTDAELRDQTGFTAKRLKHIRQHDVRVVGEGQLSDEEGESYLPGLPNKSSDNLWAEYVYNDLDPVNQRVYDMILGRNGHKPHTPSQVAGALGISTAAISQRTKRIADMLEEGGRVMP